MRGYLIILFVLTGSCALGQSDGNSPQFWNNLGFGWNINNAWSQNNEIAFNFLADKNFTWREISYFGNVEFAMYPFLELMSGLYFATTNQDGQFRTNEIRPFFGVRVHTSTNKRFSIANRTRLEWRHMYNNNDGWDPSWRFRNRTTGAVALNKETLNKNGMLSMFGYFEWYSNSEKVEERFFKFLKYKIGLSYRISNSWRVNVGTIFQQSENTIEQPTNLPSGIVTNIIIETAVSYRLLKN